MLILHPDKEHKVAASNDEENAECMTAPFPLKLTFRLVDVPGGDVEVPYVQIKGLRDDRAGGDGSDLSEFLSLPWPLNKMQAYTVMISVMSVWLTLSMRRQRRKWKCFQPEGPAI